MHKCETCSIVFSRKQAYETHLKSKKHAKRCEPNKLHICDCGKSYSCKQSLYVHKKKCNKQPCEKPMDSFMEKLEKVQQKNEELEEELKQLKAEKSVTTNRTTTNNHTNNHTNIETQNNNITINLNAHGCENLDYLTKNDIMESICHAFKSIPNLVAKIYFNPDHPENHNIKITDRRSPYISVYTKDNKWKLANKRDTVGNMIDNSFMLLDDTFEYNKSRIPVSIRNGFERLQKAYEDSEKKTMKNINKEVDMVIMNGPD